MTVLTSSQAKADLVPGVSNTGLVVGTCQVLSNQNKHIAHVQPCSVTSRSSCVQFLNIHISVLPVIV